MGTALERQRSAVKAGLIDRLLQGLATRGVHQFTEPVHEEITHRIYGCEADKEICGQAEVEYAPPQILAGVRWNDDPPFRLTSTSISQCKIEETVRFLTQPVCWVRLFKHAESTAGEEYFDVSHPASNLMYRSHFGDLQFIHAMGSRDGERAEETRRRILIWAEFTWHVAMGEYTHGTLLKGVPVEGFDGFFGNVGWTVQDLFTLGNPAMRRYLGEVAFGSLLHMVEDSFARGHVDRGDPIQGETCPGSGVPKPGIIRSFHSYQNQEHGKHAEYDSRKALASHLVERPNVIAVGRVLRQHFEDRSPWETVQPYVACIFSIEDPSAEASSGAGFAK